MTAPSRRPVTARVLDVAERPGVFRIEFTPEEVGTHLIDVSTSCTSVTEGTRMSVFARLHKAKAHFFEESFVLIDMISISGYHL